MCKDCKSRGFISINSPTFSTFSCWKIRFKTQVVLVSVFFRRQPYGLKKWRWSIRRTNWSLRDQFEERFFQISRCWTRTLLLLWTRSSGFLTSRRRAASRSRKPKTRTGFYEEDRSPTWSIFLLGYWRSWNRPRKRWSILRYSSWWQHSGMHVEKIPSDDILESLYKFRIRESARLKTVLELYDMENSSGDIDAQYIKKKKMESDGEEEKRSETQIGKLWRQKRENWNGCSGCESQEIKCCWKRTGRILSRETKSAVFERRDKCSFWHDGEEGCKTDTKKPLHTLNHKNTKCVEKKEPWRPESIWEVRSTAVQRLLERYLHQITLWRLASSRKSIWKVRIGLWNRVLVSAQEAWGATKQKAEEGWCQKCSSYIERCTTVGLRISGRRAAGICIDFTEENQSLGTNSTSTIHESYAASRRHPRKQRPINSRSVQSFRYEIRGQISGGAGTMCPRRRVEIGQKYHEAQRNGQSFLLTYQRMVSSSVIRSKTGGKFVVDYGASMDMLSRKDLTSAELETVKVSKIRRRLWQPTAKCKQKKKRQCMPKNWINSWQ